MAGGRLSHGSANLPPPPTRRGTIDDLTSARFADFAAHLIPEAFTTPTRADRVLLEARGLADHLGGEPGRLRFREWAVDRLRDAVAITWPDGDHPHVVAYTSDGTLLRRYEEPGCGHVGCVVEVVRGDVPALESPWILAVWLPRPQARWEEVEVQPGVFDEELVPPTDLRWTALWYAEARGRGVADSVAGLVQLDGDEILSQHPAHVTQWGALRDFHRILFRHPARRRHPLRRRR